MPLLKCSAGKARPQAAIGYITNPNKAASISVMNLFDDEDYAKQFEQTSALYGKGKGFNERKYYHFKLSCARQDSLSPQEAHKFAQPYHRKCRKSAYGEEVAVQSKGLRCNERRSKPLG